MKISAILSFSLLSMLCTAQAYQPFPTTQGTIWREQGGGHDCFGCCFDGHYIITGDTIIDSTIYHKLNYNTIYYHVGSNGCDPFPTSGYKGYAGAFRNDIPGKKVWIINSGGQTESILYDFNISIGDTMPFSSFLNYPGGTIITSIDSVLLNGVYHKKYNMDNCSSNRFIIEGVGNSTGLMSDLDCLFEWDSWLTCLKTGGVILYPNGVNDCDPVPYFSTSNRDYKSKSSLFPNPSYNEIHIKLNETYKDQVLFKIIGINGNLILENQEEVKDQVLTIETHQLTPGTYLIQLMDGNYPKETITFYKMP